MRCWISQHFLIWECSVCFYFQQKEFINFSVRVIIQCFDESVIFDVLKLRYLILIVGWFICCTYESIKCHEEHQPESSKHPKHCQQFKEHQSSTHTSIQVKLALLFFHLHPQRNTFFTLVVCVNWSFIIQTVPKPCYFVDSSAQFP